MGSNNDIREVDAVARHLGMTPDERKRFGRYIERCKRDGEGGTKNARGDFTWDELVGKANEFLEEERED